MAIFVIFPAPPRENVKTSPDERGFLGGFSVIFPKVLEKWHFFGVPVIKEDKAIALRAIDIMSCFVFMRNAMDPGL